MLFVLTVGSVLIIALSNLASISPLENHLSFQVHVLTYYARCIEEYVLQNHRGEFKNSDELL